MPIKDELKLAVEAGVLDVAQADRLTAFAAARRAEEYGPLSTNREEERAACVVAPVSGNGHLPHHRPAGRRDRLFWVLTLAAVDIFVLVLGVFWHQLRATLLVAIGKTSLRPYLEKLTP